MDRLINLLVTITLIDMMIAVGLRVTWAEIAQTLTNRGLLARALLVNYALVPTVVIVLLVVVGASPSVAIGFLVLAVCPGAPYGPPLAQAARADVAAAVGLMVILAASSAIVSPILLSLLLPWVTDTAASISPVGIMGTLLMTQLLPLIIGLLIREFRPEIAAWLVKPCELTSKLLNLGVLVLILIVQFQALADIRLVGLCGMLMLFGASLWAGWIAAGPNLAMRKTLALTTTVRNAGVGLVIITGAFPGTPAASAAVAYGLLAVLGSMLLALWWGRRTTDLQSVRA